MQSLKQILDEDYIENLAEAETAPYSFDYEAFVQSNDHSKLEINTRLSGPPEQGSIYYGRTIERFGENEFLLFDL